MKTDFNIPQRQSFAATALILVNDIKTFANIFLPVFIFSAFKSDFIEKKFLWIGFVFFILFLIGIAILKYLNFIFYFNNQNEFILTKGIVNKSNTIVQLSKIQNVSINQSFLQKILNVFEVAIDTAGSEGNEISIKAISYSLAIELKTRLLQDKEISISEAQLQPKENKIEISALSLTKMALTSKYTESLGLIVFIVFSFFNKLNDIGLNYDVDTKYIEDNFFEENQLSTKILITFILAIILLFCINFFRVVIKYFGYCILLKSNSLIIDYGIIHTKSTIINPKRVQIITISRNYFQKLLDIMNIKIDQVKSDQKEKDSAKIEIPGCNESEKSKILELLFRKQHDKGLEIKSNYRKTIPLTIIFFILPLIAFLIVGFCYNQFIFQYFYLVFVYLIFTGFFIIVGFRNYKLFVNENFIIKQSGVWDITNEIIEPSKIQAISTSQLFWHKKHNIGTVTLHTAGGDITFKLGDYKVIKEYVNLWLFQVESTNENWM